MSIQRTDKQRRSILDKINKAYHSSDLSIKEACSKIGISDATYYNWKNRLNYDYDSTDSFPDNSEGESKNESTQSKAVKKVLDLKKEKPFLGYKKISKQLAYSHGIQVSTRKVKEILVENNLDENNKPESKDHPPRRFERSCRNEMWMMDIMNYTIKKEGRLYLISILDDYSRFITSYGVFKRKTIDNVIDVLHEAIETRGIPTELLTDQGSQFHSWKGESRFSNLVDNLGLKHILASRGHPRTIGKIESFHRNIQRELLKQEYFESLDELKAAVDDYIDYYNNERVHMGIDYLTPADRYYNLKKDTEKTRNTSFKEGSDFYLVGRIEGQPLRATQNKDNEVDIFLAGKKIKTITSYQPLKKALSL